MNQLMKNLRLPVAGLMASTGLNAGGVDAAKVEEAFGPKNQSAATRGLGENLAEKAEGVQVAQYTGGNNMLLDIQTAAEKLKDTSVINTRGAVNDAFSGACADDIRRTIKFKGKSGLDISARVTSDIFNGAALEIFTHNGCDFEGYISVPIINGFVSDNICPTETQN